MKRMKDYDGMQVVMSRGNLHKTKQSAGRLFPSLLSLRVFTQQLFAIHSILELALSFRQRELA
jgi:hypothetical protein